MNWGGKTIFSRRQLHLFAALVLIVGIAFGAVLPARAAAVTSFSDTLSTIKQSVVADHTFTFTIADAWGAGETLTLDFPTGFTNAGFANTEPEDFDITDDGVDKVLVATSGCDGGSSEQIAITTVDTSDPVGFTFTLCATDTPIGAGSVVTIEIGNNATSGSAGNDQMTNQSAANNATNSKITLTGGGGFTDTGTVAIEIVTDNTLAVTGTVDPQISCVLSSNNGDGDANPNTTTFGVFTLATVTTATDIPTWTISTNATNGYSLAVRDQGSGTVAGLYNATASYNIPSATADLNVATSGYGLQGTKTNGDAGSATTTIQSPFTATGTNVGTLVRTAFPGSGTALAAATGPVSNATVISTLKARVSGLDAAGSYADTLTYVCTGIY